MKLASYVHEGRIRPGLVVGDVIVSTGDVTMLELIADGTARARLDALDLTCGLPLSHVRLLAPIPRPTKNVFCVGRNYKLHIEEGYRSRGEPVQYPKVPEFFSKPPTTVCGPGDDVLLPAVTAKLDYEVELAFVIGKTGRDIPVEQALEHIFGFTIANDVTARDLQRAHGQWFKGKALDTTCPLGPWIVTADGFDPREGQRLWLKVNGETRQSSRVTDLLFDCAAIIAHLSAGMTLEPGDIVATGTPSGVGLGMDPQVWLRDGDVMEAGIDGIGSLTNTVRAIDGVSSKG